MAKRLFHRKLLLKKGKKKTLFFFAKLLFFSFLALSFLGVFTFIYFAKDLPRPEKFTEHPFVLPTKIYDRTGTVLLYEIYGEEKRTLVSLDKISPYLKNAVLAAEDANFYNHIGIDPLGIARALLKNLVLGKSEGASTLSQQLIRSTFLTMDKTAQRKIRELILTLEMERRYSKDQIFEWYLNQVPFGSNTYGVEAASQLYFKKSAENLSLQEAAVLASLIQAPSRLSPYGPNKKDLLARKDYVLDRMAEEKYISKKEADQIKKEEISFSNISQSIKAPHFVFYVKKYLEDKYGEEFLKEEGLKVYTTLDWDLQMEAETDIFEGAKNNKAYNANNAALVAIDPKTGEILSMIGSADQYAKDSFPQGCTPGVNCQFEPEVNVAVYGEGRQPGSAFKPFVYAEAFTKGYTMNTVLWDVKTEFNPDCSPDGLQEADIFDMKCYHPENYNKSFSGPISLKNSLARSINITSVKTLYLAGVKESIDLAKSMGLTTLNKPLNWYGLSLVLGGGEVKLLDMVSAYGVFATDGLISIPTSVLKIEDRNGNIIEENKKTPRRILEPQVARQINSILSDNEARSLIFGSHSLLYFPDYEIAAKTGTTQDYKDGWTIGYSPSIVVGVWVGNNDNTLMLKEPGVV
ncbi:MAG: transglycosylase domain-containing protein, partial [Candidatus Parcubacteria bacterium]|nr:transglycosylase domain-containing protein [Candidatus Parcubacteria bacterium]